MTAFSVRAMIGSCDCCSTKRTNKVTSLVAAVVVGITCYIAAAFFAFVLSTLVSILSTIVGHQRGGDRRTLQRGNRKDNYRRSLLLLDVFMTTRSSMYSKKRKTLLQSHVFRARRQTSKKMNGTYLRFREAHGKKISQKAALYDKLLFSRSICLLTCWRRPRGRA